MIFNARFLPKICEIVAIRNNAVYNLYDNVAVVLYLHDITRKRSIPYLSSYKKGLSLSRLTTNN